MGGYGVVPIVRAPWNDMVWIKRILDAGAYGVMIPR
jgi:2-dehydro-3-deoxyglucarate aldolase/4-hydroxy-2-oxoheptanedioate aldolase